MGTLFLRGAWGLHTVTQIKNVKPLALNTASEAAPATASAKTPTAQSPAANPPSSHGVRDACGKADRRLGDRRQQDRRQQDRRQQDRRQNSLATRLEYGFWKAYATRYDANSKSLLRCSLRRISWLVSDLSVEAKRYRFINRYTGTEKHYEQVLIAAITEVADASPRVDRMARAVIEEIAETITHTYTLEAKDRRNQKRRTAERRQVERRDASRHAIAQHNSLN